jgi:transcriptional regulator with XRE-family HTH domain
VTEKSTQFRAEVGLRLKRLREHLNVRQEDLGALIGMGHTGVSNIEKGLRGLDPVNAVRLKHSTGVTLDWLYAGEVGALPAHLAKLMTASSVPAAKSRRSKAG